MQFEQRLAMTVASVIGLALMGGQLAACGGDDGDGGPPRIDGMCDGGAAPANYLLATGYVEIPLGTTCPDVVDAELWVNGCTFLEWQQITCGFEGVTLNQVYVDDGYGGGYRDTETTPDTGYFVAGDPVDVCAYEGVFYLPPNHATCGRPLLRDGAMVLANIQPGPSGWPAGAPAVCSELSEDERALVADYWMDCATMEHASVASFSHFALDLMRLGAPPELLRGAHHAALDEIEHARLCFGLASGYHGQLLGPGPLPAGPVVGSGSLVEVAEALVREGCIGETLAAIDAAARLAVSKDTSVRAALEIILKDESAHAALAWRSLKWILTLDTDGAVRERLTQVFFEERQRWTSIPEQDASFPSAVLAHGLLETSSRAHDLSRAWREVIEPSWAALAASPKATAFQA